MFRRRRRTGEPEQLVDEAIEEQENDDEAGEQAPQSESEAVADVEEWGEQAELGDGPYDSAEIPDDGVPRLDLGGLLVPILDGMEVRVDVDPQGQVVAATLVDAESMMQIGAFAAPRSAGIWDEVRAEIAETLRSAGGSAEELTGPFGTELAAQVPTESGPAAPARFLGVDRPRWFLRALLSGPAAVDTAKAERLEAALGLVVVARGSDAMPARDPIPLRLPQEALDAAAAQAASATEARGAEGADGADGAAGEGPGRGASGGRAQPDFNPLERGPEITETR